MTIIAWRLVKWVYRAGAFSGDGSYQYGGRWNSPTRRVVYVGESQALSALENIVHFKKGQTPPAYSFLSAEFDMKLVQALGVVLPPNWATMPLVTAALGDQWYASRSSCILAVPTALVPKGTNYLINVTHPDFKKVKIGAAMPFAFDLRIAPTARAP